MTLGQQWLNMNPFEKAHVSYEGFYTECRHKAMTPNIEEFEQWLNAQPRLYLLLWGFDI